MTGLSQHRQVAEKQDYKIVQEEIHINSGQG